MAGMKRMMKPHDPRKGEERERVRRIPFAGKILMLIGALTVLYFLITYVLIPVLAMMTVA